MANRTVPGVGVKVATRVVALYVTVPGAAVPAAFLTLKLVPLTPVTASLKVAVAVVFLGTLVAPAAGVRAVTVGAVASAVVVNVQVVLASGFPAVSVIAEVNPTV